MNGPKISIDGDESVFSCLHCGQRVEPGALSSAVIVAEQQLGQTYEAIPPEPVGSRPESHGSIAWKYESTYYHIYGQTPLVDDILDPIFIGIPRSAGSLEACIVEVDIKRRAVSSLGTDEAPTLDEMEGEWYGPLKQPA